MDSYMLIISDFLPQVRVRLTERLGASHGQQQQQLLDLVTAMLQVSK